MESQQRKWLIGVKAIADYMGWSSPKVYRMVLKYGFPAWLGPAKVPGAMAWQTCVDDIEAWIGDQRWRSWQHLATTATGRQLMSTRDRPKYISPWPKRKQSNPIPLPPNDE